MMNQFAQDGVSFRYPGDWQIDQDEVEQGWTIVVQSPSTAFVMITYDDTMPDIEGMAETALEALRSEYPTLEAEPRIEALAEQRAVGHDINFFSLDLPVTCWTRSLYAGTGSLLVLCQASDIDLESAKPMLQAICGSLVVAEEEDRANDDTSLAN